MNLDLRRAAGLALALASTTLLVSCVAARPVAVQYDAREESTAITNLAVVSPENLFVFNTPTFADDKNLLYSAKQWVDGQLPNMVSVWRSPAAGGGGAATKLIAAGQEEMLFASATSPSASNVYMSVNCALFSTGKTGTGGRRKYTGTGYCDYAPIPFPGEKRILFQSCTWGSDCYFRDSNYIWLVNPDGTNMIQLRQGTDAALSPDAKTIVFSYGGDVWTMRTDGSEATNVSASEGYFESGPAYSLDGKKIFFARARKLPDGKYENSDIWVMNVDGSEQIQLTQNAAWDGAPYQGPDGFVYFISNRGALVNGKNPQRIWRMQVVDRG